MKESVKDFVLLRGGGSCNPSKFFSCSRRYASVRDELYSYVGFRVTVNFGKFFRECDIKSRSKRNRNEAFSEKL